MQTSSVCNNNNREREKAVETKERMMTSVVLRGCIIWTDTAHARQGVRAAVMSALAATLLLIGKQFSSSARDDVAKFPTVFRRRSWRKTSRRHTVYANMSLSSCCSPARLGVVRLSTAAAESHYVHLLLARWLDGPRRPDTTASRLGREQSVGQVIFCRGYRCYLRTTQVNGWQVVCISEGWVTLKICLIEVSWNLVDSIFSLCPSFLIC